MSLASKLLFKVNDAWNRRYAKIFCRNSRLLNFQDVVLFVEEDFSIFNAYPEQPARQISNGHQAKSKTRKVSYAVSHGIATQAHDLPKAENRTVKLKCHYCSGFHVISKCGDFSKLALDERQKYLNNEGRYFNCFFAIKLDCRRLRNCKVVKFKLKID